MVVIESYYYVCIQYLTFRSHLAIINKGMQNWKEYEYNKDKYQ